MIKKSLQGQIQTKVCTNISLITKPPAPPHPLSDIDCMAQIWGLKVIQPFLLVLYETTLSIWMTSQADFFSYKPKNSHLPGRKMKYQLNTKMINWSIDWRIINSFLVPHNLSPQFLSWNVMWDPVSYKLASYKLPPSAPLSCSPYISFPSHIWLQVMLAVSEVMCTLFI